MSTPAMIWLLLALFGLGIALEKDGKPKTGRHSFLASLIATTLIGGLLYWGGFFAKVAA